jgi:hypothetical protein
MWPTHAGYDRTQTKSKSQGLPPYGIPKMHNSRMAVDQVNFYIVQKPL